MEPKPPTWTELKRQGYGSFFNILWLSDDQSLIKKEARNNYGKQKLTKEQEFYKYLKTVNIDFPVPEITEMTPTSYTMKYYSSYRPLVHVFPSLSNEQQDATLVSIKLHLSLLHASSSIPISLRDYTSHLTLEMKTKLESRFEEIKDLLEPYSHITHVNGTKLLDRETILKHLGQITHESINDQTSYRLHPIHGDCQFNNILVQGTNLLFIDPRGQYGSSTVYGIPEYDEAKVLFALTGYDTFDQMTIDTLDISGNHLTLPDLRYSQCTMDKGSFITALTLGMWLGNAHCFRTNPKKAVFSSFYALWLSSCVLTETR